MPIRNLEKFIENTPRALHTNQPVSQLAGTRLGIDATHWLKSLINDVKDPTIPALGATLQPRLRAAVERDVAWFKSHKITPLVVFSGLAVRSKTDRLFAAEKHRADKRKDAWACYTRGQIGSAHVAWNATQASFVDMQPAMMALLGELGVEFIRAPYASWGQLAYFLTHPAQPVHAVYAGLDLLMFDVDRLITKLDTPSNTFSWVDKSSFLSTIGLTKSQFLDACILAGFDWISTYGPLVNDEELPFSWPTLISLLVGSQTGISLVYRLGEPNEHKQRYMDDYARIRCAVRHHLVLTLQGAVEPLNKESAPIDLHDVFGHRLPAHVYCHLATGHVSPGLISPLLWTVMPEFAPACGGETSEYQDHVQRWSALRALASAVACKAWEVPYWRARKVTAVGWYAPEDEHSIDLNAVPKSKVVPVPSGGSEWRTSQEWIDKFVVSGLGGQALALVEQAPSSVKGATKTVNMAQYLQAVAKGEPAGAARDTCGSDRVKSLKAAQLAATVSLKFLELRGLADPESHRPTTLGHALLDAVAALDPTLQEPLVLAMELVRDGVVHARPYSRQYHLPSSPAGAAAGLPALPATAIPHMLVLTRLASALEPKLVANAGQWKPELDRDLLAVSSLYKHTARTLHGLCEGILLHYAPAAASTQDLASVAAKLPFALLDGGGQGNKSAAMAILVNAYLTQVVALREKNKAEAEAGGASVRERAMAYVVDRFKDNVEDPKSEVDKVKKFVKVMADVVVPRMAAVVDKDVGRQLREAVAWWDAMESGAPVPPVQTQTSTGEKKRSPSPAKLPQPQQQQSQQQQARQRSPVEATNKPSSPSNSPSPVPAPMQMAQQHHHHQQHQQPQPMHPQQQYQGQGQPGPQQQQRTGSGSGRGRGSKRGGRR